MLPFNKLKYSTKTIIAVTNMSINLDLFCQYMHFETYAFPKKKRGRKKEGEVVKTGPDQLDYFPVGTIIALRKGQNIRGEFPKRRQTVAKTSFRNSITIQMKIDDDKKFVNGKVSSNGKFQITGCNDEKYAYRFIYYIYETMKKISEQVGESLFTIHKGNVFRTEYPAAIINVVMKNINFKIGFHINRERLDDYIRSNTDYYSLFLADLHTCVNIKMRADKHAEEKLDLVTMKGPNDFDIEKIDYSIYNIHYDNNKKNEKVKYHTFLVFYSGSVILSSSGPETEQVYNQFSEIIMNNVELFKEDTSKKTTINSSELNFTGEEIEEVEEVDVEELDDEAEEYEYEEVQFV